MEEFSICFDTSKTRLNYREFLSNQVFNLPGGAYMSTHLDEDGAHRVSINLESLLGRRYKIVLSAKPALPSNENQITAAKRTTEHENGRHKKRRKKSYTDRATTLKAYSAGGSHNQRIGNKNNQTKEIERSPVQEPVITQENIREYFMKKLFTVKKWCSICQASDETFSDILKCSACGVEVHQSCYGVQNSDELDVKSWKCLPCSMNLNISSEKGMSGRDEDRSASLKCVFCFKSGGALKQTADGRWAHMSCALRIDNSAFFDTKAMNRIGIVDSYGKRRGHLDKFIEQQIKQQNNLALTKKPLVAGDDKDKPGSVVSKYSCAICKAPGGLKIKCAVVGCNEYFHGSCLTPTNSITFTKTKGGRVVMNTLCKFHFGLAAEETTVLPQHTNSSVQANDLTGSKVFNYTNYMSDKNRESNTSHRRASSHSGSSSSRKTTNSNSNPNIPKHLCSVPNRKNTKYKSAKKEFYKALYSFHPKLSNGGSIMDKPPVLAHQELDLYNFCILVLKCGGFHSVVENEGTWSRIFKALPNYSKTETSASYRLKRIYQKFLYDFETTIAKGSRITATNGLGRVLKEYVKADYGEAMAVSELNDDSDGDEDEDSSDDEEEESSDEESSSESEDDNETSEDDAVSEADEESQTPSQRLKEGESSRNAGNQKNLLTLQKVQAESPQANLGSNISIDGFVLTELS